MLALCSGVWFVVCVRKRGLEWDGEVWDGCDLVGKALDLAQGYVWVTTSSAKAEGDACIHASV